MEKKYVALVTTQRCAEILAKGFKGFVEEKIIHGKTMFSVYFYQ